MAHMLRSSFPAAGSSDPAADPSLGSFYSWWQGDLLPDLALLSGLRVVPEASSSVLAALTATDPSQISARCSAGHRPYLARLDDEPVACGWVAERHAAIGELGLQFDLPPM